MCLALATVPHRFERTHFERVPRHDTILAKGGDYVVMGADLHSIDSHPFTYSRGSQIGDIAGHEEQHCGH
jgi:hypothetical protein